MGVSYQDIATRLAVVEDKIDFLMSAGQVTKRTRSFLDPRGFVEESLSMLDLYREIKTSGSELTVNVIEDEAANV